MCVCVSADMYPYCSVHDEWLIMKLCMYSLYVGYNDANNVSNFGGDPVSQLNFLKRLHFLFMLLYGHGHWFCGCCYATRAGCWSMEDRRRHQMAIPA